MRRAKLYYLRGRVGKRARVRERRYTGPEEAVEPGLLHEPEEDAPVEEAPGVQDAAAESTGTAPEGAAQAAEQASGTADTSAAGDADVETAVDEAEPPEAGAQSAGDPAA